MSLGLAKCRITLVHSANKANRQSEVNLLEQAKKHKSKQSEQACAQAKHIEPSQQLNIVKPKIIKAKSSYRKASQERITEDKSEWTKQAI